MCILILPFLLSCAQFFYRDQKILKSLCCLTRTCLNHTGTNQYHPVLILGWPCSGLGWIVLIVVIQMFFSVDAGNVLGRFTI